MGAERSTVRVLWAIAVAGSAIASLTLPGKAETGSPQALIPQGDIAESKSVEQPPISELQDIQQSATTVRDWVAQIEAATVQVTSVKLEQTESGLEIELETAEGKPLQVDATKFRAEGNSLIAEIPNAILALPEGQAFTAENPTADITTVQVVQEGSQIRVRVVGKEALPKTEVTLKTGAFAYSLNPETEEAEEELIVTGEGEGRYFVPDTSTATKTDTPIRDIPASIQIVPQQVIRDRNVRSVTEAVETVSGVVDAGEGTVRIIRGFYQGAGTATSLRNGYRVGTNYSLLQEEPIVTIEQVEVLKGPGSVLFGALEPGGVINTITKKPLREPYYKLGFDAGNYGFYQPSIDLSGSLTADRTVLYRFITAYKSANSFIDFVSTDNVIIAPSITLNLGDRVNLNLYYEYSRFVGNPYIPSNITAVRSDGSLLARNLFLGYPDISYNEGISQKYGYELKYNFSDNWQIRNALSINNVNWPRQLFSLPSGLVDDRFVEIFFTDRSYSDNNYFGQIDLLGKFNTGSISHQLLVGFDFNHFSENFRAFDAQMPLPPLDLFNLNYDIPAPELVPGFRFKQLTQSYGVYFQDQITFSKNWKLLIGGRYDWVSNEFESLVDDADTPATSDGAFSPRIGLVYQPNDTVSLYASYSRSFLQTTAFSSDQTFKPTRGTQYEVGIKTDFLDKKLSATLAAYQITKTNVTTPDPDPERALLGFSIQTGEQRSRGIELDVVGELLPGWKVTAAYAYTDAKVTQDNSIPVGNWLYGVPAHQASLWTTYEIQKGDLKGLGFGLGLFYVGERQADSANTLQLEGYLRTDAALYYRRGGLRAALNVRNLFDTDYVSFADNSSTFVQRGAPFTITGSISWEF
ncbi:MAG: TonB-dependent siderophore receptor [Aphanocapsa sp. GSE-SYN-MK-11-07L]|jgi:iron complex outermembrane receptor protein|nr:TonB-dependent siderophore receptor [Aphanocapsa sp. GSE-SYN-MK-11-07L]